jgi:hypothetical protein
MTFRSILVIPLSCPFLTTSSKTLLHTTCTVPATCCRTCFYLHSHTTNTFAFIEPQKTITDVSKCHHWTLSRISSVESRPLRLISYAVLILFRFVTLHNMLVPSTARRRRYYGQPQTKQTCPSPYNNSSFNFTCPTFNLFTGH